ncbi:MAG: mRNA-capping enzyme subunit beta [Candelina mexicana]|nr:MAG: mRNA-capping enzyme subunit beta [Candelina mexicana]
MDLRSIINPDASSPPRAQPLQPSPVKQNSVESQQVYHGSYVSPASNPGGYQKRPAPPPPLQPPGPNDFRSPGGSSSYHSAQSPYQQTPSSSLSGGQYPFPHHPPQSPAQGSYSQAHPQRDSYPSITPTGHHSQQPYGYPSQSPYTPSATTPAGSHSYSQQHLSQSSHSSPTPGSAHSQVAYAPRESPISAGSHSFPQPQRFQQSQPDTPLGPPIERQRPAAGMHKEEPTFHNNHYNGSPVAPSYPQMNAIPPSQIFPNASATSEISPIKYNHQQPMLSDKERNVREYLIERDRERSLSVSPKTKIPSQPRQETAEKRNSSQQAWSGQVTPAKRKAEENAPFESYRRIGDEEANSRSIMKSQDNPVARPVVLNMSGGHPSMDGGTVKHKVDVNQPTNGEDKEQYKTTLAGEPARTTTLSPTSYSISAQQPLTSSSRPNSKGRLMPSPMSPTNRPSMTPQPLLDQPSPRSANSTNNATPQPAAPSRDKPSAPKSIRQDTTSKRNLEVALGSTGSAQQPPKKKRRKKEIPIWAQCVIPGRWNSYKPQTMAPTKQEPTKYESIKRVSQDAQGIRHAAIKQESRTHTPPSSNNGASLPLAQPVSGDNGALGPWEPSITNTIPYEEITRGIADFLMLQVVQRDDVAAGAAQAVSGQEAVLEIEAKIGQLINPSTDERLALPIRSECIIDSGHPNLRTNFRSSMTEAQHRNFNQFLNDATRASKLLDAPPGSTQSKARIPMTYIHRRERDSFHALPQSAHGAIPALIREHPSIQKHGVRVRVSHDQVTGKEIAKIIKVRIADLEIYSPLTAFDWRVSVSLEMKYEGPVGAACSDPDRNKDRMSYHHLAYDIDLTQVTTVSTSGSKPAKEHELEVEIDAAEVRKQGRLAIAGQPHQYEDLIRGFVDNVRLLARAGTLRG